MIMIAKCRAASFEDSGVATRLFHASMPHSVITALASRQAAGLICAFIVI